MTSDPYVLQLEGLATIADVWVNDRHVLHTENMFRSYEVEADRLEEENDLLDPLRISGRAHSKAKQTAARVGRPISSRTRTSGSCARRFSGGCPDGRRRPRRSVRTDRSGS